MTANLRMLATFCVFGALVGCRGRPLDPSEQAAVFDRTVYCFEGSYERARRNILRQGARARPMLVQESQSPDPERELTARILLGWLDHNTEFERVSQYARGRHYVPHAPGDLPRRGEDERNGMYALRLSPHAYLWMIEQWWKGLTSRADATSSVNWALRHLFRRDSPSRVPQPPDMQMARRLWRFANFDGTVRSGNPPSSNPREVNAMWSLFRRAVRGGASATARVRLATFFVLSNPTVDDSRRDALLRFFADVRAAPLPSHFHDHSDAAAAWLLPNMHDYEYPANTQYRLRQRTDARRVILMRPLRDCP